MRNYNLVHWQVAFAWLECVECQVTIYPSERYAIYNDRCVDQPRIRRIYCSECGQLLEDSLTTTKDVK